MKYCIRCITPVSRPNMECDDTGVCRACLASESKSVIDWSERQAAFLEVVNNAKALSGGYDCLVPVSGGKDSTWQIVQCLEVGLNPLAVTWKTPGRTSVGQRNLDNLVTLGVDHVDYQVNPNVEKKFMLETLRRVGSTALPMHLALFNIPLTIAVRFKIPLVVWGENSAFEYGGPKEEQTGFRLDEAWLRRYGVTHGTTAKDWVSDQLTEKELTPYFGPTARELTNVLAVFLGYYFAWDPQVTLRTALAHGFERRTEGPKTGYYDYADIDDDFISIHHWLKWYKFGMTRLFDNLSIEIREGRCSRDEAIDIVRQTGEQRPLDDIDRFCQFTDISYDQFFDIAETHRNRDIWVRRGDTWTIPGFLVPDWEWT